MHYSTQQAKRKDKEPTYAVCFFAGLFCLCINILVLASYKEGIAMALQFIGIGCVAFVVLDMRATIRETD